MILYTLHFTLSYNILRFSISGWQVNINHHVVRQRSISNAFMLNENRLMNVHKRYTRMFNIILLYSNFYWMKLLCGATAASKTTDQQKYVYVLDYSVTVYLRSTERKSDTLATPSYDGSKLSMYLTGGFRQYCFAVRRHFVCNKIRWVSNYSCAPSTVGTRLRHCCQLMTQTLTSLSRSYWTLCFQHTAGINTTWGNSEFFRKMAFARCNVPWLVEYMDSTTTTRIVISDGFPYQGILFTCSTTRYLF
jgi:hypothetical protein